MCIAIGRSDKSNTIKFYNPITRAYYSPPVFKLDEGKLQVSLFPLKITFDGGLVCRLLQHSTDPVPGPFPPGTHINIMLQSKLVCGTIQSVPLPPSPVCEEMLSLLLMIPSKPTIPSRNIPFSLTTQHTNSRITTSSHHPPIHQLIRRI